MPKFISSTKNELIQEYAKLKEKKYRDIKRLIILEGPHMVKEGKKFVETIISLDSSGDIQVTNAVMNLLTNTVTNQGIVAIARKPLSSKIGDKVLILKGLQDPGNVGTLIRTAVAFGYTDVIIEGTDPFSPKSLRSSQGAIFKINIISSKDVLSELKGHQKIAAVLDKEAILYSKVKQRKKFALILGNEGSGLGKFFLKKCDVKVYIPIKFESLNVAQAGAILLNNFK